MTENAKGLPRFRTVSQLHAWLRDTACGQELVRRLSDEISKEDSFKEWIWTTEAEPLLAEVIERWQEFNGQQKQKVLIVLGHDGKVTAFADWDAVTVQVEQLPVAITPDEQEAAEAYLQSALTLPWRNHWNVTKGKHVGGLEVVTLTALRAKERYRQEAAEQRLKREAATNPSPSKGTAT